MSNLAELYRESIVPELAGKLQVKNFLVVPKVTKVVLNVGLGEAVADKKLIEKATMALKAIAGQQPKVTKARVSISGFKLRKGMPIGLAVTLRGRRMYHFLEKLFRIVLPRLRDFQGLAIKQFDGHGNYTLGLLEQIVFPEVDYEKIDRIRGLEITIVTDTGSDEKAKILLEALGMPFKKSKIKNPRPRRGEAEGGQKAKIQT